MCPRAATRRSRRAARRLRTVVAAGPGDPRAVVPARRPVRRRPRLGPRRVRLLARVDDLPARGFRTRARRRAARHRPGRTAHAGVRCRATAHGDARVTTSPLSHPRPARLVARTEAIPDPGDLLDHLGTGGFAWLDGDTGFVTAGTAARVPLEGTTRALDAIDHTRAAGTPTEAGPRSVGALPFEGGGELVIPSRIVGRTAKGAWQTTISGATIPSPLRVPHPRATQFSVRSEIEIDEWRERLGRSLDAIERGAIEKVVLSRDVEIEADAPFDVADALAALRATQPGCTVYGCDGFVGASPELLVRRRGRDVESRPMAGTGDDPDTLLASRKDANEHRIVVEAIVDTLGTVCEDVSADGPAAIR